MGIDEARLNESIAGLRNAELSSDELDASLRQVVNATREIFDADGSGLMLIDDQDALHYVGAHDERSAAFEAAQEETGEGPCVDSLVHNTVVSSDDLLADPRWPALTERLHHSGIRAMLGVPVRIGGSSVGSLNVFRLRPAPWDDSEVAAIRAHSTIVEEVLASAMLARQRGVIVDQLTHALEHRVSIERAVGVIMARRGVDPTRAFNHLRLRARNERRSVREIAEETLADSTFAPADPPPRTEGSRGPS